MSFLKPAKPAGRKGRQTAIRRTMADLDLARMCENIRATYEMSSSEQRQQGISWYLRANETMGDNEQRIGILAALSPGTSWERNVELAHTMLETGDCPHAYGNAIDKARMIRDGQTPDKVLGGRKVRSFYNNCLLHKRTGHVTIDRHAASIALLGPSAEKLKRTATLTDKELKILDRPGAYILIAACYRTVAREYGILPHELQAVTWLYWREAKAYHQVTAEF